MEAELRLCYNDCMQANKQMADLILAENSSSFNRSLHSTTVRRRSITPPPDFSLSTTGGSHRIPNGSTSTIASSASSSSSTSSHFLGRHRFFPNLITNHAQKMAHHFEKKLLKNKKDISPSSGKNISDTINVSDKHSWSLWPLLASNNILKRSESANDIPSAPLNSFLDIPAGSLDSRTEHGKRSPSPFRKHSMNELGTKSPECLALPNTHLNSDASQQNRNSDFTEMRPMMNTPSSFGVFPKEMLFNPLYFTAHSSSLSSQTLSTEKFTLNGAQHQSVSGIGSVTPSSSSFSNTQLKYPVHNESSLCTLERDKPPPLPPKTYQSRSLSSTRSSIASNTSFSSTSSKDCQRFPLKDTDSGLGTMPTSTCDLEPKNVLKCCAHEQNRLSCVHSCCHRPSMCNSDHMTHSNSACAFHSSSWQQTHHHCSRMAESNVIDMSQVTLRPKKNRGRKHKCEHERNSSPPPLPPPDSILFSSDTTDPQLTTHCFLSRRHVDERNKENYNCNSSFYCAAHNIASTCQSSTCAQHHSPPLCTCRLVRTYRREHKTQSMAVTKSVRSYSIAESANSTLKSSLTSNSLTVDFSTPLSHSTSFPQHLCSYDSQPPPLPPKRRNMQAYMVVVGNYSGPIDTLEMYRYTTFNFNKSMIDTKTLHAIRQNSNSSSVMSLSSSASSSSSLSTNTSSPSNVTTSSMDHFDKQQYHHLPIAPPPPVNESSSDKSPTPPPPQLPPRRDKLNELPLAPPPPPAVSSSSVQQQRMQQTQSSFSEQPLLAPRSSTPVKQPNRCTCQWSPSVELDSHHALDGQDFLEEMNDEELVNDEELPIMVKEEPAKPDGACIYCSEDTVHIKEECILSQTDVPSRLFILKTPEDEDDLGDLVIRAGTIDALVVKATQASATGGE